MLIGIGSSCYHRLLLLQTLSSEVCAGNKEFGAVALVAFYLRNGSSSPAASRRGWLHRNWCGIHNIERQCPAGAALNLIGPGQLAGQVQHGGRDFRKKVGCAAADPVRTLMLEDCTGAAR